RAARDIKQENALRQSSLQDLCDHAATGDGAAIGRKREVVEVRRLAGPWPKPGRIRLPNALEQLRVAQIGLQDTPSSLRDVSPSEGIEIGLAAAPPCERRTGGFYCRGIKWQAAQIR